MSSRYIHIGYAIPVVVAKYWVNGTGEWSDATNHWASESGGIPDASNLPTTIDNVIIDSASGFGGGGTITFTGYGYCHDFTCSSGHTFTITAGEGQRLYVYGSLILETGVTWTTLVQIWFSSTSVDETITSAGRSLPLLIFDGAGGKWTLLDNLTARGLRIDDGTFDANDKDITATANGVYMNGQFAGDIITLYMGSGTWTVEGDWYVDELGGSVVNLFCETSKIIYTGNYSFTANGKTYYDIEFQDYANITQEFATNNATFRNVTFTPNCRYYFSKSKTYIITGTFTAVGSAGNLVRFENYDGVGQHTFSKSSGIVECDYLDLFNSNAIGGAIWYAGSHSIDEDNNDGWIFSDPP